jgi:hypothetical protein
VVKDKVVQLGQDSLLVLLLIPLLRFSEAAKLNKDWIKTSWNQMQRIADDQGPVVVHKYWLKLSNCSTNWEFPEIFLITLTKACPLTLAVRKTLCMVTKLNNMRRQLIVVSKYVVLSLND